VVPGLVRDGDATGGRTLRVGARRRPRRFIAAVLLAVTGSCATGGPPQVAYVLPIHEFDLPSGLRVAIEQADTAGMVGIALVVDSGYAEDPAGVPGVAHLVEHMVLRTPDAHGLSLDNLLANLGAAGTNGFTTLDKTAFCTFAPRSALEEVLAALTARLAAPLRGADEALLAKEQLVIREEMALRKGVGSMSGLGLVLAALAPPGHPLDLIHDDIVGASGAHVSLEIARAFVAKHYTPNRMTLVISGAVSPELGRQLVGALPAALYGHEGETHLAIRRSLAKSDLTPRPGADLASHPAAVKTQELWVAWLLPPVRGLDTIPFEVLGGVVQRALGNLMDEGWLPDVLSVGAGTTLSTLGGALTCHLVLRPSANPAEIQKRVGETVAALSDLNFRFATGARFAYVSTLRSTVLSTALSMESIVRRTMVRAKVLHDDAGASLSKVMDALEAISPDVIADLADRYLRAEQARGVLLVPADAPAGARGAPVLASLPARSNDAADDIDGEQIGNRPDDEDDDAPSPGELQAIAQAPGVGAAVTTRLPNGLTLIALRRPGLPFASMVLGYHADPQPGEPAAARDAVFFARTHPFVEGPLERGIVQRSLRDPDSYEDSLSMFAVKVEAAFDLLADEAQGLEVRWPSKAFDRWLESATLAVGTPAERGNTAFSYALWGPHVYALRLNRGAAAKLTSDQIKAWLDRVRRPANGALVIVGDIDPRAVAQMAADKLSDWHGDPAPPSQSPAAPVSAPRPDLTVILTEDPHRPSTDIRFGCFLPPVRAAKDDVAGRVFAEMLGREMRRRLRLELGISYAPNVRVASLRGGTFVLDGHLDVDPAGFGRALKILRGWLDPGGPPPETRTFEGARWRLARRSGLGFATNADVAQGLFNAWNAGLPLASLDQFPHDLASLTADDLTAVLAACRASAVVSVIGRGPLSPAGGVPVDGAPDGPK
jgi:zinc protease